ncbi:MAG: ABC transporter ATP-binding protein [Planctomycetia bacterium]|nr:ABC transporter ATP-binding protein [Planctomycetia bacterium]
MPILEVKHLKVRFRQENRSATDPSREVHAVNDVSFHLKKGETLGIVGESGSGKSVTNLSLMGLVPDPPGKVTGGEAFFDGQDLLKLTRSEMAEIRGNRIAMVFQDPMTSLNPFLTVSQQMTEITRRHLKFSQKEAREHAVEILKSVGIPAAERRIDDYPHQMSGGMRQRIVIAMAISCQPELLIADEPTTALDVTIQAQILDLLRDLQQKNRMAITLITHDLGVIADSCHRVLVMYAGRIVEQTDVHTLFKMPRHPYTRGLLASMPRLDEQEGTRLSPIPGHPPNLAELPSGCAFHPRCPLATERCHREVPVLEGTSAHQFACFHKE